MDYNKYDYVGGSVGICNDGSRYVVGAPGMALQLHGRFEYTDESLVYDGCAYAFYDNKVQKIQAPQKITRGDKRDRFGACCRISGDGSTLALGSYNAKRVYIYKFNKDSYSLSYEIIPVKNDFMFGYNLWLSEDGNNVVVGSPESRLDGEVYHYINGNFAHSISPIEPDISYKKTKHYGRSIWLSDDAQTLMIGCTGNSTVYEYAYVKGKWIQTDLIRKFGNSISRCGDDYVIGSGSVKIRHGYSIEGSFKDYKHWFGYSVDIFPNGNILVGSPLANNFKGKYEILTPDNAANRGLYLHPQHCTL